MHDLPPYVEVGDFTRLRADWAVLVRQGLPAIRLEVLEKIPRPPKASHEARSEFGLGLTAGSVPVDLGDAVGARPDPHLLAYLRSGHTYNCLLELRDAVVEDLEVMHDDSHLGRLA